MNNSASWLFSSEQQQNFQYVKFLLAGFHQKVLTFSWTACVEKNVTEDILCWSLWANTSCMVRNVYQTFQVTERWDFKLQPLCQEMALRTLSLLTQLAFVHNFQNLMHFPNQWKQAIETEKEYVEGTVLYGNFLHKVEACVHVGPIILI